MSRLQLVRLIFPVCIFFLINPAAPGASSDVKVKWKYQIGEPGSTNITQTNLSAAGDLKWKYETSGDIGNSSPAIGSDGTIYIGNSTGYSFETDYLYALNPDGTLIWKYKTDDDINSSPAVGSDGTIYFGSDDDYFYALSPDGWIKWRYQTSGNINSSPAIGSDGTIYFGSDDDYFYALKPDRTLLWRYKTDLDVNSSPAIGSDGTIYFGSSDSCLYALNPNGTLKWKYKTGGKIYSSPAIDSDGTIYFGAENDYFYALKTDSTLKWKYQIEGYCYSPAIGSDGTIYFGAFDYWTSYHCLIALNPDCTVKWRFRTEWRISNSPLIDNEGTIYFSSWGGYSFEGYLYALNPNGTLKWTYKTGLIDSSPAIDNQGIIYFGSEDEYLYALDSGTGAGLADSPWPKFRHGLQNTGRSGELPPTKSCDFTGDGSLSIHDIIKFLLIARDNQSDPRVDWNGDGSYAINDAIALWMDIINGNCAESSALLAGAEDIANVPRMEGLHPADIEYLEHMMARMDLTPEQESAFRLALYGEGERASLPKAFSLEQNYPNPFNPATTISYRVPEGSSVRVAIEVYDLQGRLVRTLVNNVRESGAYSVFWDGTDEASRPVPSGIYFYRMRAGDFVQTRKMVILK